MYPKHNQMDPENPLCSEDSAYPANPDSEYGWEKLFSERLYLAYAKNYGLNCKVARYHNIFRPQGTWDGGREKAPAALCRKIAQAKDGGSIEIWGDGLQTRSFLFIDECLDANTRLLRSNRSGPVNIGSEEIVSINQLADMIMKIACKKLTINHIDGPLGVRGRNSDNRLIKEVFHKALNDDKVLTKPVNNVYMTDLLQAIINSGKKIQSIPIYDDWVEVDTTEDLKSKYTLIRLKSIYKN